MKKIVALVLALALALSLCTVAFAVVPEWTRGNGGVNQVDVYAMSNQKAAEDTMTYHAAKAPKLDKDGYCTKVGNIAYYTFEDIEGLFVMSSKYDEDALFAVKTHDAKKEIGEQTSPEALYYMLEVDAVEYAFSAKEFKAWGDKCEQYSEPDGYDEDEDVYVKITNGYFEDDIYATAATATDLEGGFDNVLVGDEVYTVVGEALEANKHEWVASKWDKDGDATEYTCSVCKTVGKAVKSPYDPATRGHKVEQLEFDLYVYFDYTAPVDTTATTVDSSKTFDAGVAMYVGLSLASVAGSAVVIGKKKEF